MVADYLDDSHRTHIEKMAGDAGFTVDYFTEGHLPQDRAGEYEVIYGTVPPKELRPPRPCGGSAAPMPVWISGRTMPCTTARR